MNTEVDWYDIYREMHSYYEVPKAELPVGFLHRAKIDLGHERWQRTYVSCGQSMTMVAMKAQGIEFDPKNASDVQRLMRAVPTEHVGIDPKPLARGMKRMGIRLKEYENISVERLVMMLRDCPIVAILAIQAPWCTYDEINMTEAGHYVAAGYVDLRKQEIYVHDSGNGSPWGRIKTDHLPYIWHDCLIGRKDKVFSGWALKIPVIDK